MVERAGLGNPSEGEGLLALSLVIDVEAEFANSSFADFKSRLADGAVERLGPINAEMRRLLADPGYVDGILRRGAEKARARAADNIARIHDLVGFLSP